MHNDGNMIKVKLEFFWFNMIIWLLSLLHLFAIFNLQKILIEFFTESFNPMLITLFIPKFGICLQIIIVFSSSFNLFFVFQNVCVKVV